MSTHQIKTVASSSSSSAAPAGSSSSSSRPARPQISHSKLKQLRDAAETSNQPGGGSYNIWYNKFSGGDTQADRNKNFVKADTRCNIQRDQGWTKADGKGKGKVVQGMGDGPGKEGNYCCLFFARGHCPNGSSCTFLHRLPPPNLLPSLSTDIFGRTKHSDYRDDMGGVGSLLKINKTLYVGRIHEEPNVSSEGGGYNAPAGGLGPQWRDGGRTLKGGGDVGKARRGMKDTRSSGRREMSATEKVLWRHFGEWGEIESIKHLPSKSCAFVTYVSESSSQFAKEAMTCQSLDHDEILNVRWSTDDPNPNAQKRQRDEMLKIGTERIVEEMGKNGEMLRAGRMLNELEGAHQGLEKIEPQKEEEEEEEDGGGTKRTKFNGNEEEVENEELKRLIEENKQGWKEIEREEDERLEEVRRKEIEEEQRKLNEAVSKGGGMLSLDALVGLKGLRGIRNINGNLNGEEKKVEKKESTGLAALGGYGSESEEE